MLQVFLVKKQRRYSICSEILDSYLKKQTFYKQKEKKAKKEKKREKREKKERKAFEEGGESGKPEKPTRRERREKKREKLKNAALNGEVLASGNTGMEGKKVLLLKKPDVPPKPVVSSSGAVDGPSAAGGGGDKVSGSNYFTLHAMIYLFKRVISSLVVINSERKRKVPMKVVHLKEMMLEEKVAAPDLKVEVVGVVEDHRLHLEDHRLILHL